MLSGGFFDNDPFFAGHREHMRQMDSMFRDPFGGMMSIGAPPGIPAAQQMGHQQHYQQQQQQGQQLAPMGMFGMGGFGGMFQNMRRMMDDMHATFDAAGPNAPNGGGQMYSQSSFMSYSNMGGGGQPRVFQASTSTSQAPGGVRETRKTVRDSESGLEKMHVGRHLGERGHVIERQRNRRTGNREENQEFVNLDEEEAPGFNREWEEKAKQPRGPGRLDYRQDRADRRYRALPGPSQRHNHHRAPGYRDRE